MKYLAAYLLAELGGKSTPSVDDLKGILSAVGANTDEEQMQKCVESLQGKTVEELISAGRDKMSAVPAAGAVAPAGAGSAPAEAAATSSAGKEEAKKDEPEEESDEDMGFGLFD